MQYCLSSLGYIANQISRLACIDVGLHTGSPYIEEKVVYVGNIPRKTIQWETRKKILQYYKYMIRHTTYVKNSGISVSISSRIYHDI